MKKLLLLFAIVLVSLSSAHAADFYTVFQFNYAHETPDSVYIPGASCTDAQCNNVDLTKQVELFDFDAFNTCWNNFGQNQDETEFLSCVEDSRIQGNTLDTQSGSVNRVVLKEQTEIFGSVKYFFPEGDSYIPEAYTVTDYQCDFEVCVDTQVIPLQFERFPTAIAEVGQLNIKNVDNELLPIQVEVPVEIEETVCSGYRFTNPDVWRPTVPSGYSDFSANTQISLDITRVSTNDNLYSDSVAIPIEADTCAGLAAFSWTPDPSLENEQITFRVETEVIDNQVESSQIDWAQVTETIYPEDLDGNMLD